MLGGGGGGGGSPAFLEFTDISVEYTFIDVEPSQSWPFCLPEWFLFSYVSEAKNTFVSP